MKRAHFFPARMRPRRRLARPTGAPGTAWKPIGLGWRKAAPARPGAPARPPGRLAARPCWSPRFHFHFDIRSTGAPRAAAGRAVPGKPATTILWRRIDARLTALMPVVRTTSTRGWRSISHRVERALLTRWRGRRDTSWSEVVRMFRTAAMPPSPIGRPAPGASAATIFHHGPLALAPPARRVAPLRLEPRLLRPARRGAASPGASAATIFHRGPLAVAPPARRVAPLRLEPRLLHPARRGAASPVDEAARPGAEPGAPAHPPRLVWRSEAAERRAEVTEKVMGVAAASVSPLPAAAAAAPSWPPPDAVEALRPRLIDRALIDRLAEDVIGRVEKKIRIERERRGV